MQTRYGSSSSFSCFFYLHLEENGYGRKCLTRVTRRKWEVPFCFSYRFAHLLYSALFFGRVVDGTKPSGVICYCLPIDGRKIGEQRIEERRKRRLCLFSFDTPFKNKRKKYWRSFLVCCVSPQVLHHLPTRPVDSLVNCVRLEYRDKPLAFTIRLLLFLYFLSFTIPFIIIYYALVEKRRVYQIRNKAESGFGGIEEIQSYTLIAHWEVVSRERKTRPAALMAKK